MADLVQLLDQMWDEKLLNTTKSGSYFKTHPTMLGRWKEAEALKNEIRQRLVTEYSFGNLNFGDKYFGQAVVSAIKRLFSRG